jgi:chorismate synthase
MIEGIPAGLGLEMERDVDPDLKRRMGGSLAAAADGG